MGTSSARRAPTTWFWRRAKGAATRYLAPEEGAGLEAREAVARYLEALGEGAGPGNRGLLAEFRLTRKAGQNLGVFVAEAASQGWEVALRNWGFSDPSGEAGGIAAAALAGTLMEAGGGLEDAAARSALAAVLQDVGFTTCVDPAQVVTRFLAESLYQRLILDLGESLEAAGRSYRHWRQGLEGLKIWIAVAGTVEEPAKPPEQWRGLAGWQWVTSALEKMLQRLLE